MIDEESIMNKEQGKEKNSTVLGHNLVEIVAAASPEPDDSCKPVNTGSLIESTGFSENKRSYEDDNNPLSDVVIDEDEIDSYILSKKSYEFKKKLWTKMFGADSKMMQLRNKEKSNSTEKVIRGKGNNLEETHDPPSYQVARARDKEQIDNTFEANKNQHMIDKIKSIIYKEQGKEKNSTVLGHNLVKIAAAASPEPDDSCKPVNTGSLIESMGLSENKRPNESDNNSLADVAMFGADYKMMQLRRKEKSKSKEKVNGAKENEVKNSELTPAKTATETMETILKKKKLL